MNLKDKVLGNRYEIIEKIGNGGMATVYKAKDKVLNRFVAIKVLRDEFTTDDEFIKRFSAEAQSAASLTHPNIVSIFDVGHEDDIYYIVMELIKGKTLKEIINEDGRLPWKWSLNIAIQIASALEVAHRNKIIHRDIKPHNIIITEDGVAKVTDFGIAKVVSNATVTAYGSTIGSVHYFSPEHARGGFTDEKSDLYSLGVVMYEMLTGRVPFDADTPVSIALKHMQEDPIEPDEINPDIPTSVNDIIMKAMKKDIELRYQSATEMLKDLNMALKRPDGNFVFIRSKDDETKMYDSFDDSKNKDRSKKNKKENKLKKFLGKHKIFSLFVGAIILFVIAFGLTALITKLTRNKEVDLPNFVGMTREEAEAKADELKLKLNFEEQYSIDVEAGKVISQDPAFREEGLKIKEKSEIKLIISKGTEIVKVPKVIGKEKAEAIKELEDLGLVVELKEETSKKVEADIVIKQDLAENTEIQAGSTITITVSTGIAKATVPSVTGKKEEEARTALENAKLKVSVSYEEDTSKQEGIVLKQDIEANKTVEEGTTVTITVNKSESKSGTITVNVKSITGGYDTSDSTLTEADKKATVDIKVGSASVYTQSNVDKNSTAISTSFSGKGKVTISLNIRDANGASFSRTKEIDLSKQSSINID